METNVVRLDSPEGRYYEVDGLFRYPSVTTVLQVIAKPFLTTWALKEMKLHVQKSLAGADSIDRATLSRSLQEGMGAHERISSDACDFGSLVHEAIERRILDGELPDLSHLDDKMQRCLYQFDRWWGMQGLTAEAIEHPIYSHKRGYAGTVDCIARRHNGALVLLDHKTSNSFHPEYGLQGVAYKEAWQEMTGEAVREIQVVHMSKKSGVFTVIDIPAREHEELLSVFEAALRLYKWKKANG